MVKLKRVCESAKDNKDSILEAISRIELGLKNLKRIANSTVRKLNTISDLKRYNRTSMLNIGYRDPILDKMARLKTTVNTWIDRDILSDINLLISEIDGKLDNIKNFISLFESRLSDSDADKMKSDLVDLEDAYKSLRDELETLSLD